MKKCVAFILVFLVLIFWICCYAENSEEVTVKAWFEDGLGKYVPDPYSIVEESVTVNKFSFMNVDSTFFAELDGVTQEDFEEYTELAKRFGYDEQIESYGVAFSAVYKGKYQIGLVYADLPSEDSVDYMIVTLDIVS